MNPSPDDPVIYDRLVMRKVSRRIVPLIFVLYVVAYIDRANVGFAKLRMQDDLKFSEAVFGYGIGIFFIGYLLLEIPGALLVEHWSARKWFSRILISWGLCSMAMAFVKTPNQFYVARFLLGLAEAGFYPGVIVYFTHWFPRADRARALSGMILGVPASLALGAVVTNWIMQLQWFGLAGWQWVFLAEGLPAVVLGIAVPFILVDWPRQARWLSAGERDWLEQTLAREREEQAHQHASLWQAMRQPSLWLLSLGIFATNTGGYALVFWLPTAMGQLLREASRPYDPQSILSWMGLVYGCGLVGVWISGQSSDRTGDRKWHCIAGQILAGTFLTASIVPGQAWSTVLMWLCLTGFFSIFWASPFWVLPTLTLSPLTAAVGIAFINMCANLAGALGSPIVGQMKDHGIDDRGCLLFLAGCYALGAIPIALLRLPANTR